MNHVPSAEVEGKRIASDFIPTSSIVGDDEEEIVLLRRMAQEADLYIRSFSWCEAVLDSYFAKGVGGVFAVFFFHIRPSRPDVDSWIWIIVGDIPSAYLPLMDCKSPCEVFETYIDGMNKWVELARNGQTGTAEEGVPEINVRATPEWAQELDRRLQSLGRIIRPFFEDDGDVREESDVVN